MPLYSVNGTRLHADVMGAGSRLLLLPGIARDAGYYRLAVPHLAARCSPILYDPRGTGSSTPSVPDDLTAELLAEDAAALIEVMANGPVHVLASSFGGCHGMVLALRRPDLVRSLILVGAFSETDRFLEMNFRLRLAIVARCGMGEELRDHQALWTMRPAFVNSDEGRLAIEANLPRLQAFDPGIYCAYCQALLRWGRAMPEQQEAARFTESLSGIRVPTFVVTGDSDHMIPAAFSRRIADRVADARYAEIPDCGHIPFLERPATVSAMALDFIQQVEAAHA
jgi:pimeloyl-ACP methyl ester carboxylesterase